MIDAVAIQQAQQQVVREVAACVTDVMDGEWGNREWKRIGLHAEIDTEGGKRISSQTSAIAAAPGEPLEDVDFRLSRAAKDALVALREAMRDDRGAWSSTLLTIEPSGTFSFDFSYEPPRRLAGDLLYSPLDGFLEQYEAQTGAR
ncbi:MULTISPECIES: hypothetical protein [Luteimonas]|uniref:Uncharacterized protein n=1 Tax=Luteimonas chenhongjianii TaxID=2006110 RepID=A0A290XCB7_9GAMM|nr:MULTISPECIES: hypothetical protein [Luteimonas]ATD66767.1 hypothetical protein CNR27_04330 [Luteimonas chenhongjianii]RPD83819.1 hypothetical protein EGK76_13795 [Luteimonas sp. 100069]